jgi:hypothetical protein
MNKVEDKKTDLERANEALAALKENVIAADRKACNRSLPIVVQYLNGQGKDLATAVELLKFFRERIEIRRRIISNS